MDLAPIRFQSQELRVKVSIIQSIMEMLVKPQIPREDKEMDSQLKIMDQLETVRVH